MLKDIFEKAYPFDKLVEGMMQPEMVLDIVEITKTAVEERIMVNFFINNRVKKCQKRDVETWASCNTIKLAL
jgi:hypothetical protein